MLLRIVLIFYLKTICSLRACWNLTKNALKKLFCGILSRRSWEMTVIYSVTMVVVKTGVQISLASFLHWASSFLMVEISSIYLQSRTSFWCSVISTSLDSHSLRKGSAGASSNYLETSMWFLSTDVETSFCCPALPISLCSLAVGTSSCYLAMATLLYSSETATSSSGNYFQMNGFGNLFMLVECRNIF